MNKEKMSSRKEKSLITRKKIYDSAYKLFKKYGFDNVSVDSIVEEAGVSKGAFYVHFKSKGALIVALSVEYVASVDIDYQTYYKSLNSDTEPSEMLILFIGKIADTIVDDIGYDLMRCLYETLITKKIKINATLSYERDLYKTLNKIISIGVERGKFISTIPIDTIVEQCIISIRGFTYEWCIRYPNFDLKKQIIKHTEMLLTGIKQ